MKKTPTWVATGRCTADKVQQAGSNNSMFSTDTHRRPIEEDSRELGRDSDTSTYVGAPLALPLGQGLDQCSV
ncbi:hypothetical protein IF1G_10540 [Cordyceps javanica]|uniref:Uncharacterized protein n=1 Tax=Cordyceps javanica TaxID=43265 RepID=A0A545UMV0_9HYPO|nr:hypothetical protein IF1G_10540 [Cordyceps javanica]